MEIDKINNKIWGNLEYKVLRGTDFESRSEYDEFIGDFTMLRDTIECKIVILSRCEKEHIELYELQKLIKIYFPERNKVQETLTIDIQKIINDNLNR